MNEFHIYVAPFSCETRSKKLQKCYSHKGAGSFSTSADTTYSDLRDILKESPQKVEREFRYRNARHDSPSSYFEKTAWFFNVPGYLHRYTASCLLFVLI